MRPGFDADALEDLLSLLDVENRDYVLEYFLTGSREGSFISGFPNSSQEVQDALAAVWRPSWDAMGARRLIEIEDERLALEVPPPGGPGWDEAVARARVALAKEAEMEGGNDEE